MSLALVTAPSVRPILLEQVKDHLRVTGEDDIAYIDGLISAAVSYVDGPRGQLGRALISQTWDWKFDSFPVGDEFCFMLPPLQSVTSISYVDTDGNSQTFSSSDYVVDAASDPGRVYLAYQASWPTIRNQTEAITVRFVAGYGDSWNDVPEAIRHALMLLVSHWYEAREPVNIGAAVNDVPMTVDALLSQYRQYSF